jgi:hypothetical protein
MSNSDNNENNSIKLEIKDQILRDKGIVQSFELVENENNNTIIFKFNTIYDKTTVPITFLRNKMTWQSFLRDLDKSLIEIAGIDKEEDRKLIKRTVNYYHDVISGGGGSISDNNTKGNVDVDDDITAEEKDTSKSFEKTLIELALKNLTLFKDESGTPHALVKIKDHYDVISIGLREGSRFKRYLIKLFYDTFNDCIVNTETINNVVQILQTSAEYEGKTMPLHLRTAWSNTETKDTIYYDLTDEKRRCIKITKDGWKITENQLEVLFKRYKQQLPQVEPSRFDAMDDIILDKLVNLFNVKDSDNKLLLKCYIISLFIPDIAKPVLMLHGEQGSAKSTLQELVKMLVDPSYVKTFTFPRDINELIQKLSHNYITYFDNVSSIKEWISDELCRGVTGSGFSKRQLYTDDEDIIYNFKCCIGFNGINLGATKADLLDRGLIIQLERILKEKRRKLEDIFNEFEILKPELLGYIFNVLVNVLQVKQKGGIAMPDGLNRMADFEEYAEIISRCIGYKEGEFLRAYQDNIGVQIDEAIAASPLSMAIVELMKDFVDKDGKIITVKEEWNDTPTKLSIDLNEIAESTLKIDIQRSKSWPKSASHLSRRLTEVKTNLREKGIEIEKYKDEKGNRKIKIRKMPSMPSSHQESEESSTKQPGKIDGTENNDNVPSKVPSKENSEIQAQNPTLDAMDAMDGTLHTKDFMNVNHLNKVEDTQKKE